MYLFCQKNRPISEIVARFPGFGEEKVLPFLRMMVNKRLMFREGERYLSLAVHARLWRACSGMERVKNNKVEGTP